jgi:hypothetical protein
VKIAKPHLYALVARASEHVGGRTQLAKVINYPLSTLGRGARTGSLSTDVLLAIAEAGGVDPTELLTAAGKIETARRIQRLYGKPRPGLSNDERALLALDGESKRQLRRLIDGLVKP